MHRVRITAVLALSLVAADLAQAQPAAGTAFTYQGRLVESGAPANGVYDIQFRLFTGEFPFGFIVGSPVVVEDVNVVNGLFTTKVDFGNVFSGPPRWLDLAVRPGASSGAFTILSPRQELTPTPYASGIALPYSASIPNAGTLFTLDQTGAGDAMRLEAHAGDALTAFTSAGGNAVYAQTSAGGVPIYGYNLGTSGNAGFFRTESVANTAHTLEVQGVGSGAAVHATGGTGRAGWFQLNNSASVATALEAVTAGLGSAGKFEVTNFNNYANALSAKTSGNGRAAYIEIANFSSAATALEVQNAGVGLAGKFVGDVEMHGDVEVDGTLYANYGADMNRATPIAYGRLGSLSHSSGNVQYEVLDSAYDHVTYRVTVQGEANPASWSVFTDVSYSDPVNPSHPHTVRAGIPDAQGRITFHLQCTANCDVFDNEYVSASFVVYKP